MRPSLTKLVRFRHSRLDYEGTSSSLRWTPVFEDKTDSQGRWEGLPVGSGVGGFTYLVKVSSCVYVYVYVYCIHRCICICICVRVDIRTLRTAKQRDNLRLTMSPPSPLRRRPRILSTIFVLVNTPSKESTPTPFGTVSSSLVGEENTILLWVLHPLIGVG